MTGRAARVLAVLLAVPIGAAPAAADFSMQQDAFVRGFNNFAQAKRETPATDAESHRHQQNGKVRLRPTWLRDGHRIV
jgi:hypothetical protein